MAKASNTSVYMYNVNVQCILFCGFYNVQKFCILPKIDTQKYKILYAGTNF